jgi:hypothetical protein
VILGVINYRQSPLDRKVFMSSEGSWNIVRPKLKWEDGVIQDMGVKKWKNVAMNRGARLRAGLPSQL